MYAKRIVRVVVEKGRKKGKEENKRKKDQKETALNGSGLEAAGFVRKFCKVLCRSDFYEHVDT